MAWSDALKGPDVHPDTFRAISIIGGAAIIAKEENKKIPTREILEQLQTLVRIAPSSYTKRCAIVLEELLRKSRRKKLTSEETGSIHDALDALSGIEKGYFMTTSGQ